VRRRPIQGWEAHVGFLTVALELARLGGHVEQVRQQLADALRIAALPPPDCPAWLAAAHREILALAPHADCPAHHIGTLQAAIDPILQRLLADRRRAIATADTGATAAPRWTQRADLL
jgi:hypothetical protein